ncbi:hypothetical protein [Kordia sp.]|uniref:hypothetical protein n=1 Tax=Kordia sp. TaxID=1965332 RepID=UPI0025C70F6B|nr:hypothetical protein [Kordia sp.]MCH2195402.1 hypothetical protein [Kordia sp.]
MKRIAIVLLVIVSYTQTVTAQFNLTPAQQYFLNELRDAYGGQLMFANNYQKTSQLYNELARYSGMSFPVVFNQTFRWGEAHYGGLIILDYSTIHKNRNVLAFVFAHEWAHQALGHQPNLYRPNGNRWRVRISKTQDEDEADYYAGQFLAALGYDVETVVNYLNGIPNLHSTTHSSPQKRAQTVLNGYHSVQRSTSQFETYRSSIPTAGSISKQKLQYRDVFVEDFNNNANNWKIGRDYKKYKLSSDGEPSILNVTYAISNGRYVIKSNGDYGQGGIGSKQLKFNAREDFEISTVFYLYSGGFELRWDSCNGEPDEDGSYEQFSNYVSIGSDGEYEIGHHNRNVEFGGIGKEGKFTFGTRNRVYLQIIYENGVCEYYINKKLVAKMKADVCGNGASLSVDSKADVEIDNIMILPKNN